MASHTSCTMSRSGREADVPARGTRIDGGSSSSGINTVHGEGKIIIMNHVCQKRQEDQVEAIEVTHGFADREHDA